MDLLLIFGPPGVGKGTQAQLLSKNRGYLHLSTGQLLRQEISKKTEIGKQVEELLAKGHFAPDEMMLKIIKTFLENTNDNKIILDGFPRNLNQAKDLEKLLKDMKNITLQIISLEADEDELLKRLLLRGKIENRHDDKEEIIKERFRVYDDQTKPMLKFYESKKKNFFSLNGVGKIEDIQNNILKSID